MVDEVFLQPDLVARQPRPVARGHAERLHHTGHAAGLGVHDLLRRLVEASLVAAGPLAVPLHAVHRTPQDDDSPELI